MSRPYFLPIDADGGVLLTGNLITRTTGVRVVDAAGQESDTLELTLDDRAPHFELPETGKRIRLWIGLVGHPGQDSNIVEYGTYVIDEVSAAGPPFSITVGGKAVNMERGLKAPKVRAWHEKTLGELVTQIAAEQNLTPEISPDLAAKSLTHIDQQGESDLHLLRRLALDYDAVAKPAQGKLLFLHRAGKRAEEGEDVPKMTIEATQLTRWEARNTSRTKYSGVVAYYYDVEQAQRIPVTVLAPCADPQAPKFTLRHDYRDATAAHDAAEAKLATLQRGVGTLSLTLPGVPQARADMLLDLTGLRDQIDGTWYINRAEHQMGKGGYTTRIEAEVPK